MNPKNTGIPAVKKSYSIIIEALKKHRALFIPFLIFAAFELAALLFVYLIPRAPLRAIFGPPIRTFWGDKFLHYPLNFFLLPKLASLSKMFLSVVIGSLMTGMAVVITFDVYNKKYSKIKASFNDALKKYPALFIIVLIFTALFYVSVKVLTIGLAKYFLSGHSRLLFLGARIWFGPILIVLNFAIAVIIQSAFIYTIPILLIEKEKLIRAIAKSLVLFKDLFIPTIILVGLPMLLYIPVLFLISNSAFLMDKLFPEIILLVAVLGTVISSLVIDPLVVLSTTVLYLLKKEK